MKKDLQTTFSNRQYMLSKDFEIYYYNDAHFSGVRDHSHDYYEYYLFLEGDVQMIISGKTSPLKAGDVVLIPPGIPHHAVSPNPDCPYRRFVFWISRDYYAKLLEVSPAYGYLDRLAEGKHRYIYRCDLMDFHALQGKVFRLIEEIRSDRYGREAGIPLLVDDLLLTLNRTFYEQDHPGVSQGEGTLCENLISYIEEHLDEDLTLERLAGAFYVNKYYIAHLFKENFGLSVHQYIIKKRLSMCRDAMIGNAEIGKVYLMYGFKDYSSFFRAFRKEYGISPREYQKLHAVKESQEPDPGAAPARGTP